jgi:hypothetical protein
VNVNRNQSALVPFLHTEFNGVKASVYNKVLATTHSAASDLGLPNLGGG